MQHGSHIPRTLVVLLAIAPAIAQAGPGGGNGPHQRAQSTALEAQVPVYDDWTQFTTRDGLPHNSIRAVHVDGPVVWVGTEGGLARFDGRGWTKWTNEKTLGAPTITAIDVDPQTDDVWLGTWGGGLTRLTAGRFDRFTQLNSGMVSDLIFDVCVAESRVWVATTAGLSVYDPARNAWDAHFLRRADKPDTVITQLDHHGGHVYAACWDGGVRCYDTRHGVWLSDELHTKPQAGRIRSGGVVGLTLADSSCWVLTHYGMLSVGALDNDRLPSAGDTRAIDLALDGPTYARCLGVRESGREVWIGTSRGLRCLPGRSKGRWVTYGRAESGNGGVIGVSERGQPAVQRTVDPTIPDNRVRCIALAPNGVWVGTADGLAHGASLGQRLELENPPDPALPLARTGNVPYHRRDWRDEYLADAVAIGVLAPIVGTVALPGAERLEPRATSRVDRLAVQLAVVQANARGGYRGERLFRLATGLSGYERYGWGTFEDDFGTHLNREGAVGIVASIGPEDAVKGAAAFWTEIPVVNTVHPAQGGRTDVNPWVFACPDDDPRRDGRLIAHLTTQQGHRRFGFVRTPGRPGAERLARWHSLIETAGPSAAAVVDVDYDPGSGPPDEALGRLQAAGVEVVLTCCDVALSAKILQRMRSLGMAQVFVGADHIVCDRFLDLAGGDAAPVVALCPCPHHAQDEALARFVEAYLAQDTQARVRGAPPPSAHQAFHATGHLLQAINYAGADRSAVRAALIGLQTVRLAVLQRDHWTCVEAPGL